MHDDDILTITMTRAQARAIWQAAGIIDRDGGHLPFAEWHKLQEHRRARIQGRIIMGRAMLGLGEQPPQTDRDVFRLTFDHTGHVGG